MNYFTYKTILVGFFLLPVIGFGQTDTTYQEEEEDYSMYDDVEDVGNIVTYCSPKIFDLSPNRFVSLGYDLNSGGDFTSSAEGRFAPDSAVSGSQTSGLVYHGLRLNANIPVISLSKFVWQLGGGINQSRININDQVGTNPSHNLLSDAISKNLTSINLNTTLFKPLNENSFLILQLLAEMNGNYDFKSDQTTPKLRNNKYSGTLIWGKRPHDRLQWGLGLSRTYRAGELNYIPVVMYNYTSENRKWGTEILFPAKAHYRRKFNPRNILLAGYELEGTSYRLYDTQQLNAQRLKSQGLELRRSEIRARLDYQRQLVGFLWVGIQAGVIVNYNFNVDELASRDNQDFYRGFFGDQPFVFSNSMSPMPYINLTLNLVSL